MITIVTLLIHIKKHSLKQVVWVSFIYSWTCSYDHLSYKHLDTVIKQHGHSLIEFLQEAKFCIVNGRVSEENDGYTCSTARGVSVVDYFLVPHDLIGNCNNFHVTSMTDLLDHFKLKYLLGYHSKAPDHALLNFELCVNVEPTVLCDGPMPSMPYSSSIKYNLSKIKPDFMT